MAGCRIENLESAEKSTRGTILQQPFVHRDKFLLLCPSDSLCLRRSCVLLRRLPTRGVRCERVEERRNDIIRRLVLRGTSAIRRLVLRGTSATRRLVLRGTSATRRLLLRGTSAIRRFCLRRTAAVLRFCLRSTPAILVRREQANHRHQPYHQSQYSLSSYHSYSPC
jgi:hypothetical protein